MADKELFKALVHKAELDGVEPLSYIDDVDIKISIAGFHAQQKKLTDQFNKDNAALEKLIGELRKKCRHRVTARRTGYEMSYTECLICGHDDVRGDKDSSSKDRS